MNEWGNLLDYDEFDLTNDWTWAYHDSEYKFYNMSQNEVHPWSVGKIKDTESYTICVNDLN